MRTWSLVFCVAMAACRASTSEHRPHDEELSLELICEAASLPGDSTGRLPSLTKSPDGVAYLSWVQTSRDGTSALRVARLEDGEWTEPSTVLRARNLFLNWADFPGLCALGNGQLIAHWLSRGDDGRHYYANYSVSVNDGVSWSDPLRIHEDTSPAEHGFVSMVPLDHESALAIWLDGRGGGGHGHGSTALYARKLFVNGERGPEQVIDERVCDCCQTTLQPMADGSMLALYRDRTYDEVRDVSMSVFTGGTWSAPEVVHADEWVIDGCPVNGPRVIAADGEAIATWFTGVGGGGGSVRLARLATGAAQFGAPVDVDAGRPIGRPDVTLLRGDRALVIWLEYESEGRAEWLARLVTPEGELGEPAFVGSVPADRASGFLRAIALGNEVLVVWTIPGDPSQIETARLRVAK